MKINTPHKVKCEMVSTDGKTWLITHQHYLCELQSGRLVDGPGLEGRQVVIKENENASTDRSPR
jgi:hypothetical protein